MIRGSRIRKRAVLVVGAALLILAAGAAVNVVPSAAVDPPPPILAEQLGVRSVFPDQVDMKIKLKGHHGTRVINIDDPGRTAVVKFTLQPGARFPWHTHPGVVFVNIASGSFTLIDSDTCEEEQYAPGEAFVDSGHGHVHTAFNPSSTQTTVVYATFFEAPETGPLSTPVDPAC